MNATEIGRMWDFFGQTWGSRFFEQYGPRPNLAWTAALTPIDADAARFAAKALVREASPHPPTLPEFLQRTTQWRPDSAVTALPDSRQRRPEGVEDLASAHVRQFATYGAYEAWRAANGSKGKPPHPEPGSPDWWYLRRLAFEQSAAKNRRLHEQNFG